MSDTGTLYTEEEELMNTITHGVCIPIAIYGTYRIVKKAVILKSKRKFFSDLVYGLTLIITYVCSTIYHGVKDIKLKTKFRYCDHISVFFLIAGSYTPFCVNVLSKKVGIIVNALEWIITAIGIAVKFFLFDIIGDLSLVLYLSMGWLCVFTAKDLYKNLSKEGLKWLKLGGFFYTSGIIFYLELGKIPYPHAIWHVFVILGSLSHYICIYNYSDRVVSANDADKLIPKSSTPQESCSKDEN